jgi:hypothetical protein
VPLFDSSFLFFFFVFVFCVCFVIFFCFADFCLLHGIFLITFQLIADDEPRLTADKLLLELGRGDGTTPTRPAQGKMLLRTPTSRGGEGGAGETPPQREGTATR